jgi:hypothetical protein
MKAKRRYSNEEWKITHSKANKRAKRQRENKVRMKH